MHGFDVKWLVFLYSQITKWILVVCMQHYIELHNTLHLQDEFSYFSATEVHDASDCATCNDNNNNSICIVQ